MKKKRGLKTQLLVTSLVLTCFLSSFSFVRAAYAFSPHYFSYTHGSVSIGTYIEDANHVTGTSFDIATVCSFNLDNYYSGTVTLKWTHDTSNYQQHLTEWSVVAIGAKIDSLSSGQVVFHVYDQKEFQVILHYYTGPLAATPSNDPGFNFTSATSSLTAVSNHNSEYDNIDSIDTKLTSTNSTLSTLASRLQTSNGYLTDILANTNDIESYLAAENNGVNDTDVEVLLNSIKTTQTATATNISDCENYLNQIKGQVTTIRSLLGTLNINDPDQMSIIDAVNSIAASQALLENKLDTISGQLTTMSSTLTTISTTLTNLLSTVQNIDNLIDTISWVNYSSEVYWSDEITNDQNKWYQTNITTNTYHTIYLYVKGPGSVGNLGNKIIHLRSYTQSNSNVSGIKLNPVGMVGSSGVNQGGGFNIFTEYMKPYVDVYIYPDVNVTSTNYMCIEVTAEVSTVYLRYTHQNYTNYLLSTDIEYWQLLTYFKEIEQYSKINSFDQQLYSKLNEILNAINNLNLSVNVSDQDVQDVTNDFDTDIDTIHNIENNYGLNFDGWDDQITPADLSINLYGYSDTVNLFKSNITSFWASPFISLPILFSVLCFIFLVILG